MGLHANLSPHSSHSSGNSGVVIPQALKAEIEKDPIEFLDALEHHKLDATLGNNTPLKYEAVRTAFEHAIKDPAHARFAELLLRVDALEGNPHKEQLLEKTLWAAAAKDPESVLLDTKVLEGSPYKEKILEKALREAATEEPSLVLNHANLLDGKPYKEEVLEKAFRGASARNEDRVLYNAHLMDGKPYKEEILEKAFREAAATDQRTALSYENLMDGKPYQEEVLEKTFRAAATKRPTSVLSYSNLLEGKPYKEEVLEKAFREAAAVQAYSVLDSTRLLEGKPYKGEVLEKALRTAAAKDPQTVLSHLNLLEGKPYQHEVLEAVTSDKNSALNIVSNFNELHESPDEIRFANLRLFNPSQEFNIITQGREEAYTSTYNGIVNDMLGKLDRNHQNLTDILKPEQQAKMGVFLEAAATYDRMGDILKYIPQDKLPGIIHGMADRAAKTENLSEVATMSSMLVALKGNDAMRHLLETEVRNHYDHAKTPGEKDRFGLLASAYAINAENVSPDMKAFFLGVAASSKYKMPDVEKLAHNQLVDNKGVNNQLMIFSDDSDSKASFENWKATYAGKQGWSVEDKGSYVEIQSTGGKVPVHIYANKPDKHDEGLKAIHDDVAASQGSGSPSFQVFIGRGHSYHAEEYMQHISSDMKLVALGSCGGYHNLATVLQKSPDAQVIATQGTGSMYVNDPMLYHINDSINKEGSIAWSQEQTALNAIGSENKNGYLLPDKNLPLVMLKRFNELQNSEQQVSSIGKPVEAEESVAPLKTYIKIGVKVAGDLIGIV